MSLFVCERCQKDLDESETIQKEKWFFCPQCLHPLSYFGAEKSIIGTKNIQINAEQNLAPSYTGKNVVYQNPMIEREILVCEDSLKINPHNQKALFTLGLIYKTKKQPNLAKKYFEKAISLNEKYMQPLQHLADIYLKEKNYVHAIEILEKLKPLDPQNFRLYYNLGLLYYRQENYLDSYHNYQTALEISTNEADQEEIKLIMENFLIPKLPNL